MILHCALLALLCVASPRPGAAQRTPSVFVFVSTDIRPRVLQQELARAMAGVDVRVFGRIRELQAAMQNQTPAAVIARPVVLESLRLKPGLNGFRDGQKEETYVLLSVRRPVSPWEVAGKPLGAVDLLGRREMEAFASHVLGARVTKIKRVTTERDLLPLLQFGTVAAVLLPERWVSVLRKKSKLELETTPLKNKVGLPAVWFASPATQAALQPKVQALGAQLSQRFGVDQWK